MGTTSWSAVQVGALAPDKAGAVLNCLSTSVPVLRQNSTCKSKLGKMLMWPSGTSVSAPVVSGTVALMLQANPGLTPPPIKAMLQYSAHPIAGANLLQQGAGLLNADGAVKRAQAPRTDVRAAVEAGTVRCSARPVP